MSTNLFAMLGVDSGCDRATLDRAYRRRVRRLHPDVNKSPDAEADLAALNEAYSAHQRLAAASPTTQAPTQAPTQPAAQAPTHPSAQPAAQAPSGPGRNGSPHAAPPASATAPPPAPRPVASRAPAPVGTRHQPVALSVSAGPVLIRDSVDGTRGRDLEDTALLSVGDLARGARHTVSVTCQLVCTPCSATGYDPAGPKIVCSVCDGLKIDGRSGTPCTNCAGRGHVSTTSCPTCSGAGSALGVFEAEVVIPAGSTDGHRHRFPRRGLPGRAGQQSGDLFVTVHALLPPIFIRNAGGVGLVVPLHYAELACGTTVQIPTPTGSAQLQVPAGTNPGDVLTVDRAGLPNRDGTRAPLYVRCDLAPIVAAPAEAHDQLLELARTQVEESGARADLTAHLTSA